MTPNDTINPPDAVLLTDTEIDALTGPDLAAEVCIRLWGWRWWLVPSAGKVALWPPQGGMSAPGMVEVGITDGGHERFTAWWSAGDMPRPDRDIGAAFEMEEEIARRNLQERYGLALCLVCGIDEYDPAGSDVGFDLAHAAPDVRCRAALKALCHVRP